MAKVFKILRDVMYIIAVFILAAATFQFMKFNAPIIKNDGVLYVTLSLNLIGLLSLLFVKKRFESLKVIWGNFALSILVSGFIIYSVLTSVLIDYFQPLSLYDQVIYMVLAGLVILMFAILIQSVIALFKKNVSFRHILTGLLIFVFIGQFYFLAAFQNDFEYTNISGDPIEIFVSGEGDYKTFRIPTLLVIPKGSQLRNGTVLDQDQILVMAEARRYGSLDDGEIDLVQKISSDGGDSWSGLSIAKRFEPKPGKIGNSTPVFDSVTGEIVLLFISGARPTDYKTYKMTSGDGGKSWSESTLVFEGIVGPGHGIQIKNGKHTGRLVVPAYYKGGSLALYSDDHGISWSQSEKLEDGNESEISEMNDEGDLIMVVRTNRGVSLPHGPLNKLYVTSIDGGASWSDLKVMSDIKEPICMSSIVNSNGILYYSHPDDHYSRGQMTIAASYDEGKSFSDRKLIYQGASGYSELAVLSNSNLLLMFENGSIEYDERLILVRVKSF